jgi:predicted Fe-Mo cluster-binding NifX family protein
MKVAVPVWQGRVSPVFDVAEQVLLVDFDDQEERRHMESLGNTMPHERARQLVELGVDVLVCGAISWPLEAILVSRGVRVVPLVCGEVEKVVGAFRDGTLEDEQFAMPGCCRTRWQMRARCRRRGGRTPEDTP